MSFFKVIKYSSLLFLLGKHKIKVFRVAAIVSFAMVSSLLYDDVTLFLAAQYPNSLGYALVVKVAIVYSALAFALWQFRPVSPRVAPISSKSEGTNSLHSTTPADNEPQRVDRLAAFSDLDKYGDLQSRSDALQRRKS